MTDSNQGRRLDAERTSYGPLQRSILSVLFEADEHLPTKTVQDRLAERGLERAYSTIYTELARLHDQSVLEREREEYPGGYRYRYALVSDFEQEYIQTYLSILRSVLGAESLQTLCAALQQRDVCELQDTGSTE